MWPGMAAAEAGWRLLRRGGLPVGSEMGGGLVFAYGFGDLLDMEELAADEVDVVCVEDADGHFAFEDAVLGLEIDAAEEDVLEVGEGGGDAEEYASGVEAFDV